MTADRGDCQKVGRGFTGGSVLKGGWQGGFSGSGLSPPYLRWTLPPASPELTLTTPLTNHSKPGAAPWVSWAATASERVAPLGDWLGALSASIRVRLVAPTISGMVGMDPAPKSGGGSVPSRSSSLSGPPLAFL